MEIEATRIRGRRTATHLAGKAGPDQVEQMRGVAADQGGLDHGRAGLVEGVGDAADRLGLDPLVGDEPLGEGLFESLEIEVRYGGDLVELPLIALLDQRQRKSRAVEAATV